jgi:hypothetical protein
VSRLGNVLSTALFALLPFGCSAILGIEDAEVDPNADETSSGGSGGTTGTGGGNTTGTAGDGGGDNLCETYCNTVQANCTDEFQVYVSKDICLALCATMDEGDEGDTEEDTVHCRLNQARSAGATLEPLDHCPNAGLGGGDVCGANCDALCRAMATACEGEWASNTQCLDDCEGLVDLGTYNTSMSEGVSVQCRLWHVGAATQDPDPHCSHAAGAGPCSEPLPE